MSPSFEDIAKLHYKHVEVKTKLRRRPDFSHTFCLPISDDQTSELTFSGYLKAVDPISKSTILCKINDEQIIEQNLLILGHHITYVKCTNRDDSIPPTEVERIIETSCRLELSNHPFFNRNSPSEELSGEQLDKRRVEISDWLSRLRIPNRLDEVNGEIIVADTVRIKPPYEFTSDYICPTRIVLNRVKQIVDSRASDTLARAN